MTTPVVVLEHVPGALKALEAVQFAGGVLLSREAAEQLVIAVLYVSDNEVRAAAIADAADILYDLAAEHGDDPAISSAAHLLDQISAAMRGQEYR